MDYALCILIHVIVAFSRWSRLLAHLNIGFYEEWKAGKKLKILLVGYNGAQNTGSDIRVAEIAKQLGQLYGKDRIRITVMALNTESLKGCFDEDVNLMRFSSFFPFDLYRACCSHHAAILCEGSTLKSTFANALTLFMCEAAGIMSAQGKPCIAYGSEVGKMEPFLQRAVSRLCTDTYFITRNRESLNALRKLGLKGRLGTDTAWRYDGAIGRAEADRLLRRQGWDGKKPLMGIAVMNPYCWPVRPSIWSWMKSYVRQDFSNQYDKWYFFSSSRKRETAYRYYIHRMAAGINRFLKERDYFPVIIGMERLDKKACLDLRKQVGGRSALILSENDTPDIITGILRSLNILGTSRYHAAVLSMEKGCPIVAVSMDERLDCLMKEMSLHKKYLLNVDQKNLSKALRESLLDACDHEREIREGIAIHNLKYKEKYDKMGICLKSYLDRWCFAKTCQYPDGGKNTRTCHHKQLQ